MKLLKVRDGHTFLSSITELRKEFPHVSFPSDLAGAGQRAARVDRRCQWRQLHGVGRSIDPGPRRHRVALLGVDHGPDHATTA